MNLFHLQLAEATAVDAVPRFLAPELLLTERDTLPLATGAIEKLAADKIRLAGDVNDQIRQLEEKFPISRLEPG